LIFKAPEPAINFICRGPNVAQKTLGRHEIFYTGYGVTIVKIRDTAFLKVLRLLLQDLVARKYRAS
jgi:hypothetical protein